MKPPHWMVVDFPPSFEYGSGGMGGFFLTRSKRAATAAEAFFAGLELPFQTRVMGSHYLVLLRKKLVQGHVNFFESEQGRIAGVGTWLTARAFGAAALPELLTAAVTGGDALRELSGHAAFVVEARGALRIVTDRTGHYPVYCGSDRHGRHYASSVRALAAVLETLRFNHQALREFVNVEAVLGRDTVFENITELVPGTVVRVDGDGGDERYYDPADVQVAAEQIPELLLEQVARLRNAGLDAGDICCDLSGGYDSRTVAALVHCADVAHTLNTNTNRWDPADHKAAIQAAAGVYRPIVLYDYGSYAGDRSSSEYLFPRLDLARNVPRSRRALLLFEGKAARHALLLGGYGGELLIERDAPGLADFERTSGLRLEQCVAEDHRGRFLTLVEAFVRYRDKLASSVL